jgi:hypothetical protein
MFKSLLLILFCVSAHAGDLPDPTLTPGAVNQSVTQDNIKTTICVSGWTKTIRPPASYTTELKLRQINGDGVYHVDNANPADFEEDHLISLELGGNPTDEKNLWPQHWSHPNGAHEKDVVETQLKRLVCAGKVPLDEAQKAIAVDWISASKKYGGM